jgi:hypothetical protein
MKPHKLVVVFLLLSTAHFLQAKDKKPIVPALFGQAHYVYVEAVDGREFDPNLYPEDREAIADVRDQLEEWNRYSLTTEREQADLIIVVRKGRAASSDVGVSPRGGPTQIGVGQPRSNGPMGGPSIEAGGQVGSSEDLFEVCQMDSNGKRGTPLWEHLMPDGLNAPRVLLFQQFKDAVEKAYPSQPTPPPQKKP